MPAAAKPHPKMWCEKRSQIVVNTPDIRLSYPCFNLVLTID
jgi:hypothetical protein